MVELWHRDAGSIRGFVPVTVVRGSFDKAFEGVIKVLYNIETNDNPKSRVMKVFRTVMRTFRSS